MLAILVVILGIVSYNESSTLDLSMSELFTKLVFFMNKYKHTSHI